MSYIWEDYRAEKIFRTGKKISPYMETAENNHVLCEVNPLIRFSEIFSDSGVLSENEELANMIFHYLAMTDMLSGISENQIKANWLEKEILKGSFGEKLRGNWNRIQLRHQEILLYTLLHRLETQQIENEFFNACKKLFESTSLIYEKNTDTYYFYISEDKTEYNEMLLDTAVMMFWDIQYRLEIIWKNHYGIIDSDDTMKIHNIYIL